MFGINPRAQSAWGRPCSKPCRFADWVWNGARINHQGRDGPRACPPLRRPRGHSMPVAVRGQRIMICTCAVACFYVSPSGCGLDPGTLARFRATGDELAGLRSPTPYSRWSRGRSRAHPRRAKNASKIAAGGTVPLAATYTLPNPL